MTEAETTEPLTATQELLELTEYQGKEEEVSPDMFTHIVKMAMDSQPENAEALKSIAQDREKERLAVLIDKFLDPFSEDSVSGFALKPKFEALVLEAETVVEHARARLSTIGLPLDNIPVKESYHWQHYFLEPLLREIKKTCRPLLKRSIKKRKVPSTVKHAEMEALRPRNVIDNKLYIAQLVIEALQRTENPFYETVSKRRTEIEAVRFEDKIAFRSVRSK